jgi:hypothetical protein
MVPTHLPSPGASGACCRARADRFSASGGLGELQERAEPALCLRVVLFQRGHNRPSSAETSRPAECAGDRLGASAREVHGRAKAEPSR